MKNTKKPESDHVKPKTSHIRHGGYARHIYESQPTNPICKSFLKTNFQSSHQFRKNFTC